MKDAVQTLFRDVLYCTIAVIFAFFMYAVAAIVPIAEENRNTMNGDLIVTVMWPEGNNDVDLWLKSPRDMAIGFSRKSGSVWNLLRDDTGVYGDVLPLNYENAFSRGKPEGDYAINLHCYRCLDPVPVTAKLEMRVNGGVVSVGEKEVILNPMDQVTLWNFSIDENGKLGEFLDIPVDILIKKGQ